jgi:hypothetical protein
MKRLKGLAIAVALQGSALVAGQAFAAPILNGSETSLQEILNDITTRTASCSSAAGGCTSSVNVNTDQVEPHGLWSIGGTGGAFSQIIIEIAGFAASNSFGIYDPTTMTTFQIYNGAASAQARRVISILDDGQIEYNLMPTSVYFTSNLFGFYLNTPVGTWYSEDSRNADGYQHMVGFAGQGDRIRPCLATTCSSSSTAAGTWLENEYIFGWEDLPVWSSDLDYNDFVILVESVSPVRVPEPTTMALLGIGLLGAGFAARTRRSSRVAA